MLAVRVVRSYKHRSYAWGVLSDKYGRRPVLLCGLIGSAASGLLLGVSTTIWWAIGVRFLNGLLNGSSFFLMALLTAEQAPLESPRHICERSLMRPIRFECFHARSLIPIAGSRVLLAVGDVEHWERCRPADRRKPGAACALQLPTGYHHRRQLSGALPILPAPGRGSYSVAGGLRLLRGLSDGTWSNVPGTAGLTL